MAAKPSIPKGTRDFSPVEMAKRNYIFNTIRDVFHLFGYQQIETPSMENLSTLMGKYGDEGDKLLFKIQNSGDYFNGITDEELLSRNAVKLASKFCEKGLRYDLTVPFARYVVMHRDEISFPFKRYQIQPVWRADRPQKGRYREFYQCDADVVGSNSLLNEVELVQMIDRVFGKFGVRVSIKINNRKILTGIAEIIGEADKIVDITVAIDKLDKIGLENVNAELASKGIPQEAIDKLQPIILLSGSNEEKLETLKTVLATSEAGLKGVEESEFILKTVSALGVKSEVELDLTLARGLNYYTGAIFEVKALDVQIGSISGGGRYDNLTGVFGMDGMSGVGIGKSTILNRSVNSLTALEGGALSNGSAPGVHFVFSPEDATQIHFDVIRSFDRPLIHSELLEKMADKNVKTELDWQLYQLQRRYLDYQVNIGNRIIECLTSDGPDGQLRAAEMSYPKTKFQNLMDDLFGETGKKIIRKSNEILFEQDGDILYPYQLSSGEKQILVILLTVLVQDNRRGVLFMDEPEVSLHVEWQQRLISLIRQLNPNVQIVLTTHSPAVIMDGWLDAVTEVSDITK